MDHEGVTSAAALIRCQGVSKAFGPRTREALGLAAQGVLREDILRRTGCLLAVQDVTFEVRPGELFVIMGLSGSGKSTLVRLVNRLVEPSAGTVEVDGRDVGSLSDKSLRQLRNEKMSMVFQHFALFPHRTVLENATYGLKIRALRERDRLARGREALDQVGLGDYAHRYPAELSGGMKQRVGLARALATESDILLMDEPFSALDPLIRRDMQDLLLRLQADLRRTIVFITHDLNEAMRLGDRILLLKNGRVVQVGTGPQIISAPADDYVASFVADVDRSRVLTAGDVQRAARLLARLDDDPQELLLRLAGGEANGVYVVDGQRRILGVARDDLLAQAVAAGERHLSARWLVEEYCTTSADRPLIDLVSLVGRHTVPLAVLDPDRRLVGVVPRAALLDALATRPQGRP